MKQAPKQTQPKNLADYLDALSQPVFQTGISWQVVESKWQEIKEAFRGFDPLIVSKLSLAEIDALVEDRRVIRNRRKIEAIVSKARRMLELDHEYGGFRKYLRSHSGFEELIADLQKQFKFIGPMGAYHFLWTAGEEVPSWDEWSRHHPLKVRSTSRRDWHAIHS